MKFIRNVSKHAYKSYPWLIGRMQISSDENVVGALGLAKNCITQRLRMVTFQPILICFNNYHSSGRSRCGPCAC
jgi:hypothetical protein